MYSLPLPLYTLLDILPMHFVEVKNAQGLLFQSDIEAITKWLLVTVGSFEEGHKATVNLGDSDLVCNKILTSLWLIWFKGILHEECGCLPCSLC